MSLEEDFKKGIEFVQNSNGVKLTNDMKLRFYALYKVAVNGPCSTSAPSRLKVIEYSKWKAYNALGSKYSKEEAMKTYVEELNKLVPNWKASAKL